MRGTNKGREDEREGHGKRKSGDERRELNREIKI
jgi:hypothetical protein